jgi:peptide/nickel transport system substrate-binding protein
MRRLLIPVAILLLLALLIGCSTTTTPTSTSTPTQTTSTTTTMTSTSTTPPPTTSTSTMTTTSTAPPPTTEEPKHGGTLRFISYTAPTTVGGWPADTGVTVSMAYEGLVRSLADGTFEPWLAESWDIAEDRSSITFHLRKGVKFTDGTDFNAEAVKFNYDAQIENGKAPFWSSVDVVDDYTVKVNLTEWHTTTMMQFGDSNTAGIASPTAVQEHDIDWIRENPVGTGPFMFKSFTRDVGQVYVRNPDYWQPGKPYVDVYDNIIITDEVTQEAAMQAGEGDATISELGKATVDFKNMGLDIASGIQAVFTLVPDSANPDSPWSNKLVREAAAYAIDREAIAEGMGMGLWQAPYQLPPRGNAIWRADFDLGRKYDPEKAKQLMQDAGYADGFKTQIIPFPGAVSRDVTMAVVDYLSKIGIDAEPQFVDFGKYFQMNQEGWQNGLMFHPVPAYAIYVQTLVSLFDQNQSLFFKNSWERTPAFNEALDKANSTLTQDVALTRAVTDLMITDAMVIPIYEGGQSYAYQPYVKDAGFLSRGFALYWNYENVWLDK